MTALLTTLGLLVGLLHLVGGFIAGVWLLFKGEWWALGAGVLALLVARFAISFALIPGLWITGLPAALFERLGRHRLAKPFHALAGANTVMVMTAWCFLSAWFFLSRAEPGTRVPLLLWSYAIALGPWIRLAAQDAAKDVKLGVVVDTVNAQTVTFLMQLAYVTAGVAWFFGWARFQFAFLPMMTAAVMVMAELSIRRSRPEVRRRADAAPAPGETILEGEGQVSPKDRSGN